MWLLWMCAFNCAITNHFWWPVFLTCVSGAVALAAIVWIERL